MLPEKNKRELLEMRLKGIEEDVAGRTGGGIFGSTYQKNKGNSYGQPSFGYATPSVQVELYQCSSILFL